MAENDPYESNIGNLPSSISGGLLSQLAQAHKRIIQGQSNPSGGTEFSPPEMRNMPERALGINPSQEVIERRFAERLQSGIRRVESGGGFEKSESSLAGQVFHELSQRKESLQRSLMEEQALHQSKISKRVQDIAQEREEARGSKLTDEEMNRIRMEEAERYSPQISSIEGRFVPQIQMLGKQMQRSIPTGMSFDPSSLRMMPGGGGMAAGIAGRFKDVSMERLQQELAQVKMTIANQSSLSRRGLGPMMSQVLQSVEGERGTTLEKNKIEIQEQLIKKTENFISKNKEGVDQIEKFNKEFGRMDESIKFGTESQGKFSRGMRDLGSSVIAVSRMTSGLVSSIGSMARGDLTGMFSGATTFMLGIGRLAGSMSRVGGRVGGLLGAGGIGRTLGGGLGIIGGMAGAGIGAIGALGTLGVNASQRQFRDAAEFEQASYRMGLATDNIQMPTMQNILSMSGRALGGGLTLPQYSQLAIQAGGRALLTPQQSRSMMEDPTERGTTTLAEMSRLATAFGRPVQELAGQVGMVARATGANFQNVMETMTRMGDIKGMQGSLFTGEMQNAFSRLSETLMRSLGGIRGNLREGSLENIMTPMLSAGITPGQAAGVAGSLQQYVTGSIFQPQQRLLLESMGISRGAIERGRGRGGVTAAEELMQGLGISGNDLSTAAEMGETPKAFGRVRGITGIQDTERAFTILTRYVMGFSSELSNSIIETAKNVESTANLKKELDKLGSTVGTESEAYKQKMKELQESTGKVTEGQEKYQNIIKGGEFLLSFKEKMIEATGGLARAMEGLIDRGGISTMIGDINKAFQPILALAADAIKPALEILKNVLVDFGDKAGSIRRSLAGIDMESVTKKITSGELFQDFGTALKNTTTKHLSDLFVSTGSETMRIIKNALIAQYPILKKFGMSQEFTEDEERSQLSSKLGITDIETSKNMTDFSSTVSKMKGKKIKELYSQISQISEAISSGENVEMGGQMLGVSKYIEDGRVSEENKNEIRKIMSSRKNSADKLLSIQDILSKELNIESENLKSITESAKEYSRLHELLKSANGKKEKTATQSAIEDLKEKPNEILKNKNVMNQIRNMSPRLSNEIDDIDKINELNAIISGSQKSLFGKPEGESKSVSKNQPVSLFTTINLNGEKITDKTMVSEDGNSFSVNENLKGMSIFGQ